MALTSTDAFWLFAAHLARFADEETAAAHAKYAPDALTLRKALYSSAERKVHGPNTGRPWLCAKYVEGAPKLLVLGNCQGPNIARQFSAFSDVTVIGLEVMSYETNKSLFEGLLNSADYVASCLLSPQFESISTATLKSRNMKNVMFYCPLFFEGIFPDVVYWGARGQRVASAAGDYHSRIVLLNYLKGVSIRECLNDLKRNTFDKLKYFNDFDRSFSEMHRRERDCDVKFGEFIEENIRKDRLFLTVNHPSNSLLYRMSRSIADHFQIAWREGNGDLAFSTLMGGPHCPLLPEIIEEHGLEYSNGNLFWVNGHPLAWDEFVTRTYVLYDALGPEALWDAGADDQKKALRRELFDA